MFGDGSLTFREFAMREPLPLATIHDAVLEFLRGRKDAVLYGAQAVNAYVKESRMTKDVDIASTRAKELAEELRVFLHEKFDIALRVQTIRERLGFRIYQARKSGHRSLVDVRPVESLPPIQRVKDLFVVSPPELIAQKVMAMVGCKKKPKEGIHQADVYRLLLTFPELKREDSEVADRLRSAGASEEVLAAWKNLVTQEIEAEDENEKFLRG